MDVYVDAPRLRSNLEFPVGSAVKDVVTRFIQLQGGSSEDFYVISNGRVSDVDDPLQNGSVYHLHPRLCGGKGGFGSMLRALGAQIEKTTNREACRDLSGRRLRDVNHEKEMAEWLKKQSDRDAEKEQRRLERLQRKLSEPGRPASDRKYQQQCHDLLERLEDSVLRGLQASSSGQVKLDEVSVTKRSNPDQSSRPQKKAKMASACFWTGMEDLDEMLSSEDSDEEEVPSTSSSSRCGAEVEMMMEKEPEHSSRSTSSEDQEPPQTGSPENPEPETESSEGKEPSEIRFSEDQEPSETRSLENQEPSETRSSEDQEPSETRSSENPEQPETEPAEVKESAETRSSEDREPSESRSSEDREPSESRSSEDREPSESRSSEDQEPSESRFSDDQEPPDTKSLEIQEPSETRSSENPEPSETRSSENQEPPQQVMKTLDESETSSLHEDEPTCEQQPPPPQQQPPLDLCSISSVKQLEALGLNALKEALISRGMKCGGSLKERAARLFSVRGLSPDRISPTLLAKPDKSRRK